MSEGTRARFKAFSESVLAKQLLTAFEVALGVAALSYLLYRLSKIGWSEVMAELPTSPFFYILFVPRLLAIPIAEVVIYQRLWVRPLLRYWRVFLKKLAYNFGFFEYTGELYFASWVPRNLGISAGCVLSVLKDVNIISAVLANLVTASLFGILVATGQINRLLDETPGVAPYFIIAGVSIFGVSLAGVLFRKLILGLTVRDAVFVGSVHLVRIVALILLPALQWWIAIPSASIMVWLVFITTNLMLTRVPLLPSRELVFAAVSLQLLGLVDAPEATVAATFASTSALMQLGYVAFLALTTVWPTPKPRATPAEALSPPMG